MKEARDCGFTLLEILVALVVFGFLMVGLSQGVRVGLTAWQAQGRVIDRRGDLGAVDRTIRRLVRQMDPGTRTDPPIIAGTEERFAFTSTLPIGADGLSADVLLTVDGRHQLLLRWTPHIHAERTAPSPSPRSEVLLAGVERIRFTYWLPSPAGGAWVREWTARRLPALVRMRIVFPAGDARHWPDIVAGPVRENPVSP